MVRVLIGQRRVIGGGDGDGRAFAASTNSSGQGSGGPRPTFFEFAGDLAREPLRDVWIAPVVRPTKNKAAHRKCYSFLGMERDSEGAGDAFTNGSPLKFFRVGLIAEVAGQRCNWGGKATTSATSGRWRRAMRQTAASLGRNS